MNEVYGALIIAAAFGLLFFVPVIELLLPWALGQSQDCRAACCVLTVFAGIAGLTAFAWVAHALV